jgi:hypothetical protein
MGVRQPYAIHAVFALNVALPPSCDNTWREHDRPKATEN